jgi:hypothetical protein
MALKGALIMTVYAVYARGPQSTLWNLRELFATQKEADQYAGEVVEGAEAEIGEEAAASIVVEWADHADVPEELPEQWVAPVVSHYGEADLRASVPVPERPAR